MLIGIEQVMRRADRGLRIGNDELIEHGEIEFGGIDRMFRIARRGPAEAGAGVTRRTPRQIVKTRQLAFSGTKNFERIERRNSRPSLIEVDARIGEHRARGSRTRRHSEREPLRADAILLTLQRTTHPLAR